MENQNPDKRQEQSKKRQYKRWLKWLRNPQTLRLLFKLGPVIFNILRWLIELWQD
ncbi:MAG: hypothetical protein RID09_14285 [Coleofasciculus sp. G1-WW12-02]|uniref:hypothetical protein n=1 Tax=Coleofasciculus sp. G1-WW12-02 TaxID=3068483 RepID=UPI0032FBCA81